MSTTTPRRGLLALTIPFAACLLFSCAEEPGAGGSSEAGAPSVAGAATDAEIEAMAARYATFARMNRVPFRTGAHQGNALVNVYASPNAADVYQSVTDGTFAKGASLPPGAMLVKEMLDPSGGAPILTVMYKKAAGYDPSNGDYWYGRLAADGTPTRADFVGKVGFCVECHAGAAGTDRAWGVPAAGR